MVTEPVSYIVVTADGREHCRHVDHIRTKYVDKKLALFPEKKTSSVESQILASNRRKNAEEDEKNLTSHPRENDQLTSHDLDSTEVNQDNPDDANE